MSSRSGEFSDPDLSDETFRRVQAQVAAEQRGLKAEAKRVERELVSDRAQVGRLTSTLTMATGSAADALMARLAESQVRVVTMERRQRELAEHRATLDYHDVDPDAVGRALVGAGLSWNVHPATSRRRPIRSSRMIRIDFERRRLP